MVRIESWAEAEQRLMEKERKKKERDRKKEEKKKNEKRKRLPSTGDNDSSGDTEAKKSVYQTPKSRKNNGHQIIKQETERGNIVSTSFNICKQEVLTTSNEQDPCSTSGTKSLMNKHSSIQAPAETVANTEFEYVDKQSSKNGLYNAVVLANKIFFDKKSGKTLGKDEIERNLKNLEKHPKKLDYMPYLEKAEHEKDPKIRELYQHFALNVVFLNARNEQRTSSKCTDFSNKTNTRTSVIKYRFQFPRDITSVIIISPKPAEIPIEVIDVLRDEFWDNYLTECYVTLLRKVIGMLLAEVAKRDDYNPVFTAPGANLKYSPFKDNIISKFREIVRSGSPIRYLDEEEERAQETELVDVIKLKISGFFENIRKEMNKTTSGRKTIKKMLKHIRALKNGGEEEEEEANEESSTSDSSAVLSGEE